MIGVRCYCFRNPGKDGKPWPNDVQSTNGVMHGASLSDCHAILHVQFPGNIQLPSCAHWPCSESVSRVRDRVLKCCIDPENFLSCGRIQRIGVDVRLRRNLTRSGEV